MTRIGAEVGRGMCIVDFGVVFLLFGVVLAFKKDAPRPFPGERWVGKLLRYRLGWGGLIGWVERVAEEMSVKGVGFHAFRGPSRARHG